MRLPLPTLLVEMMEDGTWRHPGAEMMIRIAPFIKEELDFRTSENRIHTGECLMGAFEDENKTFHEYRGSRVSGVRDLPWIDVEKSALIAINQYPGDDVAVALDYRTSMTDPRLIGTEWIEGDDGGCFWREISPSFTEFARAIFESKATQIMTADSTAYSRESP
jgi:hypothetical protein